MWGIFVGGALILAAINVEVETLDGQKTTGALVEWTSDEVVVQTTAGESRFARSKLVAVRPESVSAQAPVAPGLRIELVDGSRLMGADYTVAEGQAHVTLSREAVIDLPTQSIASVRLKQHEEPFTTQWNQVRQLNLASDMLVIRKSEALDHLEGILGQVTADRVHFTMDGDEIPVNRDKVEGLVYYNVARDDLAEQIGVVNGRDGLRLHAQKIELVGDKLHITGLTGLDMILPLDQISGVDYSAGKIQYLSDLEPETVAWAPYFGLANNAGAWKQFGLPRYDRSFEGGPLKLGDETYHRGLAIRSRTEIVYRLPGKFGRFQAVAGIDDRVGDAGHVRLVIRGDEKILFETTMAGMDKPVPLDLDLTGVTRLKILVDYGDEFDVADHLDLAEARILK